MSWLNYIFIVSADNVVIVFTDGRSTDRDAARYSAEQLQKVADDIIGIEVGNTDETEVTFIATDRQHVFDLHDYTAVLTIIPSVVNLICPNYQPQG